MSAAINAELLAALKLCETQLTPSRNDRDLIAADAARAAIAEAEMETAKAEAATTDQAIESMQFQPTLKTYHVDVIHVMEFGVTVEVEAASPEEAAQLALSTKAEVANGDGYDWNRQDLVSVKPMIDGQCVEVEV